jgi:ribonuclease/clavin/mitogillin
MAVRNTYDHINGPHSVHGFRTGRFDFGINTTFIIYRLGETLIDAGRWHFITRNSQC